MFPYDRSACSNFSDRLIDADPQPSTSRSDCSHRCILRASFLFLGYMSRPTPHPLPRFSIGFPSQSCAPLLPSPDSSAYTLRYPGSWTSRYSPMTRVYFYCDRSLQQYEFSGRTSNPSLIQYRSSYVFLDITVCQGKNGKSTLTNREITLNTRISRLLRYCE